MKTTIRPMAEAETGLLEDFLYESIFVPEGGTPPDRAILRLPELRVYVRGFGRGKADRAMVAEVDGRVVGAAWARIMDDYGHVDDETPSLAIARQIPMPVTAQTRPRADGCVGKPLRGLQASGMVQRRCLR